MIVTHKKLDVQNTTFDNNNNKMCFAISSISFISFIMYLFLTFVLFLVIFIFFFVEIISSNRLDAKFVALSSSSSLLLKLIIHEHYLFSTPCNAFSTFFLLC
jgi:hypothetical protein